MTTKERIAELRALVDEVQDHLYEKQDMYRCRDLAKNAAAHLDALEQQLEGDREWGIQVKRPEWIEKKVPTPERLKEMARDIAALSAAGAVEFIADRRKMSDELRTLADALEGKR